MRSFFWQHFINVLKTDKLIEEESKQRINQLTTWLNRLIQREWSETLVLPVGNHALLLTGRCKCSVSSVSSRTTQAFLLLFTLGLSFEWSQKHPLPVSLTNQTFLYLHPYGATDFLTFYWMKWWILDKKVTYCNHMALNQATIVLQQRLLWQWKERQWLDEPFPQTSPQRNKGSILPHSAHRIMRQLMKLFFK